MADTTFLKDNLTGFVPIEQAAGITTSAILSTSY